MQVAYVSCFLSCSLSCLLSTACKKMDDFEPVKDEHETNRDTNGTIITVINGSIAGK